MILLTIAVFILLLGLLIFVHEFGHFVMAKRAGMKVEEFGFGFPPRVLGIRRGGTLYSLNWIPLGGFVKILGEDDGAATDPAAFGNQEFWARLSVLIAGVAMNLLLAWMLLFLGFAAVGTPVQIDPGMSLGRARISQEHLAIVSVEANSPAEYAGFRAGDIILRVDGKTFTNVDALIVYTKSRAGQTIQYTLERGRQVINRQATPRPNPPPGSGAVGFAPAVIARAVYPLSDAFGSASTSFYYKLTGILGAFGGLLKTLVTSGKLVEGLSGPVGIAVLTRDFTRMGLMYLVQFAAVLSLNLGILNLVPFPALDGGRVLFLIIEKIRGAKSVKWERVANAVGFILLIALMVAVTFRDVGRFSEQFKRLFEKLL